MKAPKCRICQTCHWSREPCKFNEEEPLESPRSVEPDVVRPRQPMHEEKVVTVAEEVSEGPLRKRAWRAKNKERYNDYQRKWMSDKRNARKGDKN